MSVLPCYVLNCHVIETLLMLPPKTKRQFHKQVGSFWSWRIESISSHIVIILVKYMLAKLMKEHTIKWKFHLLSNKSYGLQSPLAHIPKPLSLLTCSGSRGQVNEIWCVYLRMSVQEFICERENGKSQYKTMFKSHRAMSNGSRRIPRMHKSALGPPVKLVILCKRSPPS